MAEEKAARDAEILSLKAQLETQSKEKEGLLKELLNVRCKNLDIKDNFSSSGAGVTRRRKRRPRHPIIEQEEFSSSGEEAAETIIEASVCESMMAPNTVYESTTIKGSRKKKTGQDEEGSVFENQMKNLSVFDVCVMLQNLGLGEYTATFHKQSIDGKALSSMDEEKLSALNVKWFHQPVLLEKLADIRGKGGEVPSELLRADNDECLIS